jgi:PST family polysaccharide transporter
MRLGAPGVLATIGFASPIITLFYASNFSPAAVVLQFICLGMLLRVLAWPVGYIVIAKGANRIFFWTEVLAAMIHVVSAWLMVPFIGLAGAGAAFFILYVCHTIVIYALVRRLSGFRLSPDNRRAATFTIMGAVGLFVSSLTLPFGPAMALAIGVVATASVISLRSIVAVVPRDTIPAPIRSFVLR